MSLTLGEISERVEGKPDAGNQRVAPVRSSFIHLFQSEPYR